MTVAIVYASYWIYSNVVTVTSYKITLTPYINYVNGDLINVTLSAVVTPTPTSQTIRVFFYNTTTESRQEIGNATLTDGVANFTTVVWNNTSYQAGCEVS
jgi:hypothetical protein